MSAYSPSEIECMARNWTHHQATAMSWLELPESADREMYELALDAVADRLKLSEAGWDLFACTSRLQFYGLNEVPAKDRSRWGQVADAARNALIDAWNEDAKLQAADFAHDQRGEAA